MNTLNIQSLTSSIINVALGRETCLHTGNLSSEINIAREYITMRDMVRLIFAELGIDIEFSGKNEHEKSVIIDIDEDRIAELKLNHEVLRFGQTVIRADAKEQQADNIELQGKHLAEENCCSVEELIKKALRIALAL